MTAARWISKWLASTEFTVAMIALAAAVVAAGLTFGLSIADWIVLPAGAIFVNLVAAMATNTTLRSRPMLFCFHALLAVFVLVVIAERATALTGHVEVTEGGMFEARLAQVDAGPFHNNRLDDVQFMQGGYEIRYAPGMKRRETESRLSIESSPGTWEEVRVGDEHPLIVEGYRFYTSFNKGFAPVVTYTDERGNAQSGAIHLPSFPLNEHMQGNEWTPPGANRPLTLWLEFDDPVYDAANQWTFRKPADPRLVVVDGEARHVLRPGEASELAGGNLRFDSLRSWMGYKIVSNPVLPWLMAIVIAAAVSLIVYLWGKLPGATVRPTIEARHAE